MKRVVYLATEIELLRLVHKADAEGHVIPPECHIEMDEVIPVLFDGEAVGVAYPWRDGDVLKADIEITSKKKDQIKALRMLSRMYPTPGLRILDAVQDTVFRAKLEDIELNTTGHIAPGIRSLGARIGLKPNKSSLN